MGKNPAFQFYPSDWVRDMDEYDLEIQGAWIAIICRLWWSDTRGECTKSAREWSRILRKTEQKTMKIICFLIKKGIASGSVLDNQTITVYCRRMVEQERISVLRQQVGKLGGNPNLKNDLVKQKLTKSQPLHTSTSSSKINYNMASHSWENITDEIMSIWSKANPNVNLKNELNRAASWLESNPSRQKKDYRRFLNNWFSNARPSSEVPAHNPETKSLGAGADLEALGII